MVGPIAFGPISRRFAFAIRVPIERDGAVVYVLTGVLEVGAIEPILRALPADWVGTVCDSRGTVAARTRGAEQFVGRPVSSELAHALATAQEGWAITRTLEGVPV